MTGRKEWLFLGCRHSPWRVVYVVGIWLFGDDFMVISVVAGLSLLWFGLGLTAEISLAQLNS